MNRYALEMHAGEKYPNSAWLPKPSIPERPRRFGLLARNAARPGDSPSETPMIVSMSFLYELRCDFTDTSLVDERESNLDEVLPLIK